MHFTSYRYFKKYIFIVIKNKIYIKEYENCIFKQNAVK